MVDRIELTVTKYAERWDAGVTIKIWAIARADGHDVGSQSSVKRARATDLVVRRTTRDIPSCLQEVLDHAVTHCVYGAGGDAEADV